MEIAAVVFTAVGAITVAVGVICLISIILSVAKDLINRGRNI